MRRIVLVAVAVLGIWPSRASAEAVILFDQCTVVSLCNRVFFQAHLQPGGEITASLGGTAIDVLEFGLNYSSGVDLQFMWAPSNPTAVLGPGEIGPYGTFAQRWQGPPLENFQHILMEFRDPNGRLPGDLAPFFENAGGIFLAAQVMDSQTGATGFVAARLNDISPVPEPGTLTLFGLGLAAVVRKVRRRTVARD